MHRLQAAAFAIGLAFAAGAAAEPQDCYNPGEPGELDAGQPEILRVTDADLEALISALRAGEQRALASAAAADPSG